MAKPTIENIRAINDFATLFRWEMAFPTKPQGITIQDADLNFRCETAVLPKATGASIEANIRGHKVRQPGIYTYNNPITFTFIETVDNKISTFLKEWRDLCWEADSGKTESVQNVKGDIQLFRMDQMDKAIWEYKLIGCFLEDYEVGGDLGGDTSDFLKPQLSISYDYFTDEAK
tara:strand:+ start:61 stop:582 length:522 start_codon:yes stop_codon:yes gene_type:complete